MPKVVYSHFPQGTHRSIIDLEVIWIWIYATARNGK